MVDISKISAQNTRRTAAVYSKGAIVCITIEALVFAASITSGLILGWDFPTISIAVLSGLTVADFASPLSFAKQHQSSNMEAELILSRFPGPVTLYPSRKKWVWALLYGGIFTAFGFWMVSGGAQLGWFAIVFCGSSSIGAATMILFPSASALTLDRNGFQTTSLFRRHRSRWQDVTRFEPRPYLLQNLVVYDDVNETRRTLANLCVAIAGHNARLPDTYGLSADGLARLMAGWRDRAVAA
jgi:hypothetical protein